jgi:hypothetical protein
VKTILALLLILTLTPVAWAGDDDWKSLLPPATPITIPEDVAHYVDGEQCRNCRHIFGKMPDNRPVVGLVAHPLEEARRKPFRIYYWNLDRWGGGYGNIFQSRFATDRLLDLVTPTGPKGTREELGAIVRDFVPETEPAELKKRIESLGRGPDGYLEATEIQGRFTAIAWEKDNRQGKKWLFKFGRLVPNGEGGMVRAINTNLIERSIRMSEIIEEILITEGRDGLAAYQPEHFGAIFDDFGYLVRETDLVGMHIPEGTSFALALHAFLDKEDPSAIMIAIAFKQKMTDAGYDVDDQDPRALFFFYEFFPKLAKFIVQLQFEHGIVVEWHNQNLKPIFEMDSRTRRPTGTLLGFAFIDGPDATIDPNIRAMMRKYSYLPELRRMRSPSIMGENVMGSRFLAEHGTHMLLFLSQVLGSAAFISAPTQTMYETGAFEDWEAGMYQRFLSLYLEFCTEFLSSRGLPVNPGLAGFQRALETKIIVEDPLANVLNLPDPKMQPQSGLNQPLFPTKGAYVLEMIAGFAGRVSVEQMQALLFQHLRTKTPPRPPGSRPLAELFRESLATKGVAFFHPAHAQDPENTWIKSKDTTYAQLAGIGIVAYQTQKYAGRKYPVPIATAIDPNAVGERQLCVATIENMGRVQWGNSYIPRRYAELMRIREQGLGLGDLLKLISGE